MAQQKPDLKVQDLHDVDHRDLMMEITLIKENHLKHLSEKQEHLHEDIDELKEDLKETRKEFNQKIDRLDSRFFWLIGLVTATMLGVIVKVVVGG